MYYIKFFVVISDQDPEELFSFKKSILEQSLM